MIGEIQTVCSINLNDDEAYRSPDARLFGISSERVNSENDVLVNNDMNKSLLQNADFTFTFYIPIKMNTNLKTLIMKQ